MSVAGDPVVAAAPGRVIYTGAGIRGLGKLIVIRHDNNYQSVYAHNREILVKEGQRVKRGDVVGLVGSSGLATGPHLHYMVKVNGQALDPNKYILE